MCFVVNNFHKRDKINGETLLLFVQQKSITKPTMEIRIYILLIAVPERFNNRN